jgi:hypothetical protein
MKRDRPEWRIPADLPELIAADDDLTWETDDWAPIQLSVMAGTTYGERDIPLAWQIEFEPVGRAFKSGNAKLKAMDVEPDGYGWSSLIAAAMEKHHPEIADDLHHGDTEASACVIWVESEETCRRLVEVVWSLIFSSAE